MVMAEKAYPAGVVGEIVRDVKELFSKDEGGEQEERGRPGSEQPAPGKCGCHPGGIHPIDTPIEVEQREPVELVAIPVKVDNIPNVRVLPAKRASMETFYPGTIPGTAVFIQGKDPKIKRLILSVFTQGCWIGTQEQIKSMGAGGNGANNSQGFLLQPNNQQPPWEGIDQDLWAMAQNGGAVLSVRREYWPDI